MRRICLLCVCLIMFYFTACGSGSKPDELFSSSEYLPEYDVNPGFVRTFLQFCRSGDTYYSIIMEKSGDMLMVYDSESGYSGPLCAKPECLHQDASCNAHINRTISGIQVYDSRLYWAEPNSGNSPGVKIYSEELDGTSRKTVKEFSSNILDFNADCYVQFHRGYAYFAGIKDEVTNAVPSYRVIIRAEELSAGGESIDVFEKKYTASFVTFRMQIIGTKVYYMVSTADKSPDDTVTYVNSHVELGCWDMTTRNSEVIFDGEAPIAAREIWVVPDQGMYMTSIDGSGGIYWLDFDTCATELLFEIAYEGDKTPLPCFSEGLVTTYSQGHLLVKDFEGNTLLLKDISDIEEVFSDDEIGSMYAAADSEYVYLSYNVMRSYAAYPLDGSAGKVLWKSQPLFTIPEVELNRKPK